MSFAVLLKLKKAGPLSQNIFIKTLNAGASYMQRMEIPASVIPFLSLFANFTMTHLRLILIIALSRKLIGS